MPFVWVTFAIFTKRGVYYTWILIYAQLCFLMHLGFDPEADQIRECHKTQVIKQEVSVRAHVCDFTLTVLTAAREELGYQQCEREHITTGEFHKLWSTNSP